MSDLFATLAPQIMSRLIFDFTLDVNDAAAIVGNLGHESGGFKFLQEIKPLVAGSAGGYGWAQWTGPRRRAYEAYCKGKRLDPACFEANYGYLRFELKYTERTAIPNVKKAIGLANKVQAFEQSFERADPRFIHLDSRVAWANKAIDAFQAWKTPTTHDDTH